MIAFLIIANLLQFLIVKCWLLIFIQGPGTMPMKVPPYDLATYVYHGEKFNNSTLDDEENKQDGVLTNVPSEINPKNQLLPPPEIFECDSNGLPRWCYQCGSLKLLRSHHSSICDRCIPMFDHYCSFVGSTIGKNNYVSFLCFVLFSELLMLFTCITIIIYSGIWNSLHASLIVFVISAGVMTLLVGNLCVNTLGYIYLGETTIEQLSRRRWKKAVKKGKDSNIQGSRYVNVQHPTNPNLRLVVGLLPSDKPYNNGFINNLKLWFYDFGSFKTPQEISEFQHELFSETFKNSIADRIHLQRYIIFGAETKLTTVKF